MVNRGFIGAIPAILVTITLILGSGYLARAPIATSACNFISQKTTELDRDHCLKAIATTLRDPGLCQAIKGEEFVNVYQGKKVQLENPPKMECLTEVAAETNNPSLCDKVEGIFIANTRIDCLYRVAQVNKNASICDRIGGENQSRVGMLMDRVGCKAQASIAKSSLPSKTSIQAEITNVIQGECKYDSDCNSICEGNTRWKLGCNPVNNSCQKTFSDDCTLQQEKISVFSFNKICQNGECVRDITAINSKKSELNAQKTELSNNVKKWTAVRQKYTEEMLTANKKCLDGLSEVTNKLIIDSATKLGMLPKSLWDVASDITNNLLDALASDPQKMSAEEFISLNCNLYRSIQTDLDVLEKRINYAQDQYRQIDAQLNLLP